ncbi:MAG: GDSL-type esterase/lipase family protein [Frankiaceae bacterium]
MRRRARGDGLSVPGPVAAGVLRARLALACTALASLLLSGCAATASPAASTAASPAGAQIAGRPTAIVAMGDGYVSGEGGRWQGNGAPMPTDRTCAAYARGACPGYDGARRSEPAQYRAWQQQISRVYLPPSDRNGCDRSDTAEILSNSIRVDQKINIACSGASVANVIPAGQGGRPRDGEAPQADQLAQIAKTYDIRMIVLSVGGEDLGLGPLLRSCLQDFHLRVGDCESTQRAAVNARMPQTVAAVEHAIDTIRAVMAGAGYPVDSYQLVYQSYLSPIASPAANPVPETRAARVVAGCPVDNQDERWITSTLVPQVLDMQREIAEDKDVVLLDLERAGAGHEVCNKRAQKVGTNVGRVDPARVEWFRDVQLRPRLGNVREGMHPNAIMQRALGRCLELLYASTPAGSTDQFCTSTPGKDWSGMTIS